MQDFEGKGVSYCAICDGFFYRNKNVVVIGDGKYAFKEADVLKNIANSVTVLTNGVDNNFESEFKVIGKKIKEICGDSKVSEIIFDDGESISVDGIFVAVGEAGGADFAKKMGIILNGDSIAVDENMKTNVDGVFACGNVVGGLLQVCKATYEGAKAGLSAVQFVKNGAKAEL